MMRKYTVRLLSLVLCLVLSAMLLPGQARAEETGGRFVLAAEAGGKLIIAPEYISYTPGQTIGDALAASGHDFQGLSEGVVKAIDGVTGNYTRSDQSGGYDLATPASQVTHYRFSETSGGSTPSSGLLELMSAMADYSSKEADVRAAAKASYDTACEEFVGISPDMARTLAYELNLAVSTYEDSLSSNLYTIRFLDGSLMYSSANYSGVTITAVNSYGRLWQDDGDGRLELPAGSYSFTISREGLSVSGGITVSANASIIAKLPTTAWLKTDTFRVSGTYGSDSNEENRFIDGIFPMDSWEGRSLTVQVPDQFVGAVYTYAEYDTTILTQTPTLTAIYTMASSGTKMEKSLAFSSKTGGAYDVLAKGSLGNTLIYRVSSQGSDGYTYAQDYSVHFDRVPSLTGITLTDGSGTDLAPTAAFDPAVKAYTYKILDTVTEITVAPQPMDSSYSVTVNGADAASGTVVAISGQTQITVTVSANGYSSSYVLDIIPGAGKAMSFVSDKAVTVQVVNGNGVVMPYTTLRESATQNRYRYTLVPGEDYSYVASLNGCYHISDSFTMDDTYDSIIQVDFSTMDDWLDTLDFGIGGVAGKNKGNLPLSETFTPDNHSYELTLVDTEHLAYVWVSSSLTDVTIEAMYSQIFTGELYHGKSYTMELTSGSATGKQLKRFLLDENPMENMLTIRLTREEDGITYYQDYEVCFRRALTLAGMSATCDGATAVLVQEDGTTGFAADVSDYSITVSAAAQTVSLMPVIYTENLCYGESDVGYRVYVDGVQVSATANIALNDSMETQTVTITVENDKAPEGTGEYRVYLQKSPPVQAFFELTPQDAVLNIHENLSGERLWPTDDGSYQLCEGYSYTYALTAYGYVGISGVLDVTRDDSHALVITDGENSYTVTQDGEGGIAQISWTLEEAQPNPQINGALPAEWPNFRGNSMNNAVTWAPTPVSAQDGTLLWASKMGSGTDADAVGSPILVDGAIITYAGDRIYRVDTVTGNVLASNTMDHKSSFSITPPTYADGMVFVALSGGTVQAFNAVTLESLWIFTDFLGGQPNCPLTVRDGYLYTGFWNSETGNANFVCLSITDEDPDSTCETKNASWYYTAKGGYYWAGAYAGTDFVLVGTDDGTNYCNSDSSRMLLLDARTGELLDSWDNLNGDIRSTVSYDSVTGLYYFTAKGGTFYGCGISGGKITDKRSVELSNGTSGIPMSTCSPVVYNGRAYVGVSGASQFGAYTGHNISVIDLSSWSVAYSVPTQGYPQTSGLLSAAYEQQNGYVYVYYFDNYTPGKLRVLRDKAGQTNADYVTMENGTPTAYAIFTPTGDQAQYAICSPIVDSLGTIYFKNDSGYLMAFGSAVDRLEVTSLPTKTTYAEGEYFDPAGMVITAYYANGYSRDVTRYVTYLTDPLTAQDSLFTVTFPHVLYHNAEEGTAMTAGVVSTTPTVTLRLTLQTGLGDVNADGVIDEADAQAILDYEAGVTETVPALARADVSGDSVIDSNDAVLILQYLRGDITEFPAGQTP